MWVVYFHNVVTGPLDEFDAQLSRLSVADFARQVSFLVRRLRPVPFREVLERHAAGEDDPDAVAVTFDDGYQGVLTHAAPILAEAGIPAAVFVVTGTLDREPGGLLHYEELEMAFRVTRTASLEMEPAGGSLPLGTVAERVAALKGVKRSLKQMPEAERAHWHAEVLARLGVTPRACRDAAAGREPYAMLGREDLLRMLEAGWTVGSHTRTHRTLSRLGDGELREEIHGAYADLERHLGLGALQGGIPLAYPYGRPEQVGPRAPAEAEAAGYSCAFTTVREPCDGGSGRFLLPRLELHELYRVLTGR
jgi:peptidoglycan/xylan/chitin deacetylase (PgdA/CDA1 family)